MFQVAPYDYQVGDSHEVKVFSCMRETGFIKLPSERTIFNYSRFMKGRCGINGEIMINLKKDAQKLLEKEHTKYVGLLVDEVKVKEDLVYDRVTG